MNLLQTALNIRKRVMHQIRPNSRYFLAAKNLEPISSKFGFDRGMPIDRFWIDAFINENSALIKGRVLEIDDKRYTSRFLNKISVLDVLDINKNNKKANIHGDLRDLSGVIEDNVYDCIILTHVIGMIDDVPSAIKELRRILKPGGAILLTCSSISPVYDEKTSYWRFTKASVSYLFKNGFKTQIETKGNVLAGQCFWVGMAQEELTVKELEFNDPRFPCIVTAVLIKK